MTKHRHYYNATTFCVLSGIAIYYMLLYLIKLARKKIYYLDSVTC